jgi:MFS family permease
MVCWGTVMTLMGIVQNFPGLAAARLALGIAEAGLFPGVAVSFEVSIRFTQIDSPKYYLTMWYCRHEIQLRQAMFFSAASVAGAFSGLLAFAISKMDGVGGYAGWRWIFILEGIATVLVAVLAFFTLHDFPETATFLTEEERAFVVFRLKYQGQVASTEEGRGQAAQAEDFKWKYVRQAFGDWQIWVNIFVYWGVSMACHRCYSQLTFEDRMSSLWNSAIPSVNHQAAPLHIQHGSTNDSTNLYYRSHIGYSVCLLLRPRRQA